MGKRPEWLIEYVRANYQEKSDREIAKECGKNYATIFNTRKSLGLERSPEFNHHRRVISGIKGGSTTHARHNTSGENNANWKGGISKNKSRYVKREKEKNPVKVQARIILCKARERGKIQRLPCRICGNDKSFGHHNDYLKPLDVVWLCRLHHDQFHQNKLPPQQMEIISKSL